MIAEDSSAIEMDTFRTGEGLRRAVGLRNGGWHVARYMRDAGQHWQNQGVDNETSAEGGEGGVSWRYV